MPPKKGKSSASSGTRKKQAAKAAKKQGQDPTSAAANAQPGSKTSNGPQRGQKKDKKSKKEPKKKVFIPPPKPPQPPPDPLDTLGLASLLPPSLVLLLRKAAKKDVITRSRALEGLLHWIDGSPEEQESHDLGHEERENALVMMLPSWINLFPRLAASPTRRLRLMTAQILAKLLAPALATRAEITQSPQYIEPLIGPWSVLVWDTDRATSATARSAWDHTVAWDTGDSELASDRLLLEPHLTALASFFSTLLITRGQAIDPTRHADSTQPNGSGPGTPAESTRDAKNRDEANVEEDAKGVDARMGAGALGALAWIFSTTPDIASCEDISNLLRAESLWTTLSSSSPSSLGKGYPATRSRCWVLLSTLVSRQPALLGDLLEVLAPVVLQAAWEEHDASVQRVLLDAFLPLLIRHNEIWSIAGDVDGTADDDADDDDSDDESDDGDDDDHDAERPDEKLSPSLARFEQWLQMGCAGHPLQGLPSVLVILSSIPPTILPPAQGPVTTFLDNFWSSFESGVYNADHTAKAEFFKTFAESAAFLIGKVSKSEPEQTATIAEQQLGKLWSVGVLGVDQKASQPIQRRAMGGKAPAAQAQDVVDERISSTVRNLAKLREDMTLATPLLDTMLNALTLISQGSKSCPADSLTRASSVLGTLADAQSPVQLQDRVRHGAAELGTQAASSLSSDASSEEEIMSSQVTLLTELLRAFPSESLGPPLQAFASQTLPGLVSQGKLSSTLVGPFMAVLIAAAPQAEGSACLAALIETASALEDKQRRISVLQSLLEELPQEALPQQSIPASARLDDVATEIAASIAQGTDVEGEGMVSRLLENPHPFVDENTVTGVLAIFVSRLHSLSTAIATGASQELTLADRLSSILARYLSIGAQSTQTLQSGELFEALAFASFHLVFLLPRPLPQAKKVWDALSVTPRAQEVAINALRASVLDTSIEIALVIDGAQRYARSDSSAAKLRIPDILPDASHYGELFSAASESSKPSPAACIIDPLNISDKTQHAAITNFDVEGFTSYFRSVYALLLALEESRSTARLYPWAVSHLVMLGLMCEDEIQTPGGSGGLLDKEKFSTPASLERLSGICQRAVKLCSSMLATLCASLPDSWHTTAADSLGKDKQQTNSTDDPLLTTLGELWHLTIGQPDSSHHSARVFARVLTGIISFTSAGEEDGAKWLRLARSVEGRSGKLAEAIMFSAKALVYGTPLYDRQCSDIVSRLASTPPSKAGTEGLQLLRLASAIAPPPESSLVLVPQQRAIFCLQGLQRWFASDEDFDEEVNTRLAELFLHIAPIVQDMPGSHLDFFFDVIESNLEVADLADDAALPGLYHTLKLLSLLMSLSSGNAVLREAVKEHESAVLELLSPVLSSLAEQDAELRRVAGQQRISAAKEATSDVLMSVIRQNVAAFSTSKYSSTLCKLLGSPMREVQASSYRILSDSIRNAVKELVFESALEKEGNDKVKIELPEQLVSMARKPLNVTGEELEESPEYGSAVLTYLLAWLAIFEHFEEATVQLKSIYAGAMQRENLLSESLLPTIFTLLEPQRTRRQATTTSTSTSSSGASEGPYNPERYSIEEIFVDHLESSAPESLQQLATHLYLRALLYVPAMVREWWVTIKDRQLSMGIANYTIRHCSPLIASRELCHVRDPESKAKLQDEAMAIKILGSNEVVATYTVDEHPMEIGVKVPHDYPLHGIEVRDIRRVGVSESQWRAWLLAVQQLIVGQNGLVVDALMLFKRNAEAKFAGFEGAECAICYSIISPTDRSLPTKPCKTCSNKFHASCLYKWVTTSGNSTCPLCRSIL